MTTQQIAPTNLRSLLPKFAKSLAPEARSKEALRLAVLNEIQACRRGENPLTTEQVDSLYKFLEKIR